MERQQDITVLVVDDEPFFREALSVYLNNHDSIAAVAAVCNGIEALETLENMRADVVLSDVRMPHLDGIGLAQEISERGLSCRVVALTTFDDEQAMLEMLNAGAYGFVLKSARPSEIIEAVLSAARGGTTISPESATALRKYIAHFPAESTKKLPPREQQVLTLLHTGKNNAAIANDLVIAETTVKKIIARLLQRYNVSSRLELVVTTRNHPSRQEPGARVEKHTAR